MATSWISTSERLPTLSDSNEDDMVLVYFNPRHWKGHVEACERRLVTKENVLYWAPIAKLPTQEEIDAAGFKSFWPSFTEDHPVRVFVWKKALEWERNRKK